MPHPIMLRATRTLGDRLIATLDNALKTVSGVVPTTRPSPADQILEAAPTSDAKASTAPTGAAHGEAASSADEVAALMRVNHVGEICAQALYYGQALASDDPQLRDQLLRAADEEGDHLAWSAERVHELQGRTSLLTPLWYAGALGIGYFAGRRGSQYSLGFMAETERQVEAHLDGHLNRIPASDLKTRAIVEQMRDDEIQHRQTALDHGGASLPLPVRLAMKAAAKVMTTVAHRV